MYRPHTHCRACLYAKSGANGIKAAPTDKLIEVFDLGVQPLANDFCKADHPRAGFAPLKVMFCPRCTLAQLSVVVDPAVLYLHYAYVTSKSDMMKKHFAELWERIKEERDPKSVLEIGSNDGDFLRFIKAKDNPVVFGIDPAANLTCESSTNGIPTCCGLFNTKTAGQLGSAYDCIIARHVFCHIDDWQDFIQACEMVSDENTLIVIEAPYVGNTLANCEFDQVYHEHLSFISFKAMEALLKPTSFQIVNIQHYDIHGGTCAFFLRKKSNEFANAKVVRNFMDNENITIDDWKAFGIRARDQINRLSATVRTLRAQGKRVAGLGASAKSTVWVNACGFTRNDVEFIADNTSQKQLTTSPGSDIPIVDEGAILRELTDYVVMLCWNFRSEVLEKFALARQKGVKFIVPVPKIEII